MAGKQIEVSIKKYLETLGNKNIKVKKAILYGSCASGSNNIRTVISTWP